MDAAIEAAHGAFSRLDRRPAVFDREIREHVGEWHLTEPVPTGPVIERFERAASFVLEGGKVVLPLHEPDSADLTGEFLIYHPDHLVPCVVYHEFAADDLARIPLEAFDRSYPAWRLRFWHPDIEPPSTPEYLVGVEADATTGGAPAGASNGGGLASPAPLPAEGETLFEELREMVTESEIAEREGARERWSRLPIAQYVTDRGGIETLVPGGVREDAYGQQVVTLRVPDPNDDGPVDVVDEYGIYPESEVIVDVHGGREGFPLEADVLAIEGRELQLAPYWDRGAQNPSLSAFDLESDARFAVGELLNPVPFDRRRDAIDAIADDDRKRGWLSGSTPLGFDGDVDVAPSSARLNEFQYEAAHAALRATDVCCIHGPPGTGKTRTLVEIVRAACEAGLRVVAVAHSNQAVDNLLVGDSTPDRVDRSSIHGLATSTELTAARAGDNTTSDLVADRYADGDLYQSDVVCATTSAAHRFGRDVFDLVVVDEATQASIPATLIPLSAAKRAVLAGDHRQLPPYAAGERSEGEETVPSLFEHLLERYGEDAAATLRTQYRMHEAIAAFPNEEFYDGTLLSGQRNRTWTVPTFSPLSAIDVAGEEGRTPSNSYYNEREATVVAEEVSRLLEAGVAPADVGVITPYTGQIGKIRTALADLPGLDTGATKVATVDAFQGSEREAIVVSFVRSNPEGHSGFLTFPTEGPRRLNVALTRARKRLVLVGDFETLRTRAPTKSPEESAADVYGRLYEHLDSEGVIEERR